MAKGFLTIKDVPQDLRSKGADRQRGRLREMLANPFIPADQRAALEGALDEVAQWEAGSAATATPISPPKPSKASPDPEKQTEAPQKGLQSARNALVLLPRQPQHHNIDVVEDLKVDET